MVNPVYDDALRYATQGLGTWAKAFDSCFLIISVGIEFIHKEKRISLAQGYWDR